MMRAWGKCLLIAPQGIEIVFYILWCVFSFFLLIAPQGIEIGFVCFLLRIVFLLIAPQGIEIKAKNTGLKVELASNRTTRN